MDEEGGVAVELEEPTIPRRKWWSTLGLATVGAVAAQLLHADAAFADCQGSPCCSLARCNQCSYSGNNKSTYVCPGGYNKVSWSCMSGSRKVICGECAAGPNCYQGPWACSIWYYSDTGTHG
jgi:hypothetical protein